MTSGTHAYDNPFRFSTKYADDETGLVYYGFRYYGPSVGRWFSRDPIGERGGQNLWAFVANGPVRRADALGLAWNAAQAGWQFLFGGGEAVTLGEIGYSGAVEAATKPHRDAWKQAAQKSAEDASAILSCPSPTLTSTMKADYVEMPPVVWWMGEYRFHRKYFCSVEADCALCTYTYRCTLDYDVADMFEHPTDFDGNPNEWGDDWNLGGTPYLITGHWDDEVTGGGPLL